jgi:uncharacterized protein (DUF1697 family)
MFHGMTTRFVAFLRAINVGGHGVVPMADLRGHFENFGLADVETFIASGNVIFSSRTTALPALEKRIAKGLQAELGYEVPIFIRTAAEVAAIAKHRPFSAGQHDGALSFVVGLVPEPLTPVAKKALMALQSDDDIFDIHQREIYWLSRTGQRDSVISNAVLERALKVRSTFRGMNTMVRLVAKYGFA